MTARRLAVGVYGLLWATIFVLVLLLVTGNAPAWVEW